MTPESDTVTIRRDTLENLLLLLAVYLLITRRARSVLRLAQPRMNDWLWKQAEVVTQEIDFAAECMNTKGRAA